MGQLCEEGTDRAAAYMHRGASTLKAMLEEQLARFVHSDDDSCLWKAGGENLEDRSHCRYNEVVIDAASYSEQLPRVVEAFFYPINGPVRRSDGNPERAHRAHALFLRRFGLDHQVATDRAELSIPLVAYDIRLARMRRAPFSLSKL